MRTIQFTFSNLENMPIADTTASVVTPRVSLKPITTGSIVWNGSIIAKDTIFTPLDANGQATIKDCVPGTYYVQVTDQTAITPFWIAVPVLDGTYNASNLLTNATASFPVFTATASYALTASVALQSLPNPSASYALSASWAPSTPSTFAISASWASQSLSASYAPFTQVRQTTVDSASWVSASVHIINSDTASYVATASYYPAFPNTVASASWVSASVHITNSDSASFVATASFASTVPADLSFNSVTASYISASVEIIVPSPIYYYDAASKGYVDNLNPQGLDFYFRSASSDIATYEQMLRLTSPLSASTSTLTINNVSASQYFVAFVSPALNIPNLSQGTINAHIHIYRAGGNPSNTFTPEIYIRNAGGAEYIELAASSPTLLGTGVNDSYTIPITVTSSIAINLTDRLVCKLKCNNGTGTPTITVTVDNGTAAGINVPVPSSTYVLRSGDTMTGALTNAYGFVGTASFSTTASYATNAGNAYAINFIPTVATSASWVSASVTINSASYAISASYPVAYTLPSQISITGLTASIVEASAFQFTQSYYVEHDSNAYTITNADNGRLVVFTGSVTQTVTLTTASIDGGWSAMFFQSGSGKVVFNTASISTVLRNRSNSTGSAGQYSAMSIFRVPSGDFILGGDTA